MFLTVFALNRLGDKARQVFDPKESVLSRRGPCPTRVTIWQDRGP